MTAVPLPAFRRRRVERDLDALPTVSTTAPAERADVVERLRRLEYHLGHVRSAHSVTTTASPDRYIIAARLYALTDRQSGQGGPL